MACARREEEEEEEEELSFLVRKKDGREIVETRERKTERKEKDVRGRPRERNTRGALETELCMLLNAGHKLPVFCFRETMRELTQGRQRVTEGKGVGKGGREWGRGGGRALFFLRTLFSASPSLAGRTCILFPRALEYSRCARPLFRRRSRTSCAIGELSFLYIE